MWFLSDKGIDRKLGYLNSICNLDDPDRIQYLIKFHPKYIHEWIQEIREQYGNDYPKLTEVTEKAQLLTEYIFENPKYFKELSWIIRDLLGRDAKLFSIMELNDDALNLIKTSIQSKKYENYPYVILARYVQVSARKKFVNLVIDYSDVKDNEMAWAMAGEACETLAFLNILPKDSMNCLSRHLNDGGCDGLPADSIIRSMHVFKKFDYLIIEELIEHISDGFDGSEDGIFILKNLIHFVDNIDIAKQFLLPISQLVKEFNILEEINDSDMFEYHNRLTRHLLMFYGQLQALIHGDI